MGANSGSVIIEIEPHLPLGHRRRNIAWQDKFKRFVLLLHQQERAKWFLTRRPRAQLACSLW